MSIKKHIPNSITCCNLICGCIATCFAFGGQPAMALLFIIFGAVFDFFDGMSARLLGVSSPIGKELDSLADDVTFGVAPSTMIFYELTVMDYPDMLEPLRPILPYVAFIMAAFSALRLAKFSHGVHRTAHTCQCTLLGKYHGRCRGISGKQRMDVCCRHRHGICEQLAVGQRDSDVCPEVQALGLG